MFLLKETYPDSEKMSSEPKEALRAAAFTVNKT
jgi:hypothetical protein